MGDKPEKNRSSLLSSLIADERRLMLEKAALEVMLKNAQKLRTKLKVEQIQLSSLVQTEMGEDAISSIMSKDKGPNTQDVDSASESVEMEFDAQNQPDLDLDVTNINRTLFSKDDYEEEDDDDDDGDSDNAIDCAFELMDDETEQDIDFSEF